MSTYTPVASQTLSTSASSVTFSGIPQDYTDLVLVASMADSNSGGDQRMLVRVNNDSGTSYSTTAIIGDGTTATSGRNSNRTIFDNFTGAGNSITSPSTNIYHFMNYSNVTTYKTVLYRQNNPYVSAGAAYGTSAVVGLWRSTAAINRIDIFGIGNMASGSTFTLYGIQAGTPKAQGGQIVTTDGTYWYHAFTASGTFTPSTALTCDYMVVAGGGAGGPAYYGGGGGAGGLRSTVTATGGGGSLESALSLSANTAYSIVIGAGGAGGTNSFALRGSAGSDSSFSTITSTGGGGGGTFSTSGQNAGGNGGSSGGGNGSPASAGGTRTASPVQGYTGGTGANDSGATYAAGGGGGGAGGNGGNPTGSGGTGVGGAGGAGASISALATATNTGVSGYFAGGGGGGYGRDSGVAGGTGGAAGSGGAGAGSTNGNTGGNATANTGSGGGGAGGYPQANGSGGSGIVIVRYAV